MSNHPNRNQNNPARNPTPAEIRAARDAAGLTHKAAARRIWCAERTWQDWEAGNRRMHPAFWHLWHIFGGNKSPP